MHVEDSQTKYNYGQEGKRGVYDFLAFREAEFILPGSIYPVDPSDNIDAMQGILNPLNMGNLDFKICFFLFFNNLKNRMEKSIFINFLIRCQCNY